MDRLAVSRFRHKRGEKLPLFATGAVQFVESYLRDTDRVFEYGSGYSTPWLAKRAGTLISVEDWPEWYERIKPILPGNAELILFDTSDDTYDAYIAKINDYDPFDLVIVDGKMRAQCAATAACRLKKGGILLWDDFDPHALMWAEKFAPEILQWRRVSFDDGKVHLTSIFIKPAA